MRLYRSIVLDIIGKVIHEEVGKGKYLALFEDAFCRYVGTKYAVAIGSAGVGLNMVLDSMNLKKGSEIIMSAYASKHLVSLLESGGFKAKLVDVGRESFNINPDLIEQALTPDSRVILTTHMFGLPSDMEKITAIAKKYDLLVIEDCRQALGAVFKGRKVGSLSNAALFSFETDKLINTFGGAVVTTDSQQLAEQLRQRIKILNRSTPKFRNSLKVLNKIFFGLVRYIFINSPFFPLWAYVLSLKWPDRLVALYYERNSHRYLRFTDLQALMGLRQLSLLEVQNVRRQRIAAEYGKWFLNSPVIPQKDNADVRREYCSYVVNLDAAGLNLERIREQMMYYGVDCGLKGEIGGDCFFDPVNQDSCPNGLYIYSSNLQLPMSDELTDKNVAFIARVVKKAVLKYV